MLHRNGRLIVIVVSRGSDIFFFRVK